MIVIPRISGESVVIAGNIVVTVVNVEDDTVHLSIDYPPDVSVNTCEDSVESHQPREMAALS